VRLRISAWRSFAVIGCLLAASLLIAAVAPSAYAAPANTYDLTQLQALLDSSGGTAAGYFLTVLGGSQDTDQAPTVIPATIRSIVPNATQDGSLIMFQATGAAITQIGGIAAGMSGSPLYVEVSGQPDQLIGAVSYGDMFTTGGLGLATPIQYMTAIQNTYLRAPQPTKARSIALARPVAVEPGAIGHIVVAPTRAKARATKAAAGTAVFSPLLAVQISGLSPRTRPYKLLAAKLEALGTDVISPVAGGVGGNFDPDWSTALDGGASLGTMYSRGSLSVGALGTVTYRDGASVLAYGHPLDWLGATQVYLTNAWVSGVWNDSLEPYKIMSPAHLAGTLTQDRISGVAGTLGSYPIETPVTSSSTFAGKTVTAATWVPQAIASSYDFAILPAMAAWVAVGNDFDTMTLPGSATTTSTVVVNDGTRDYTVAFSNVWDDSFDVSGYVADDLSYMLDTLTYNGDGIAPATIKSVDLDVSMSSQRRSARIASVTAHGGLHVGVNTLDVTLLVYGQTDPVVVHPTITLPPGTPTSGYLRLYGIGGSFGGSPFSGPVSGNAGRRALRATVDDRQSVADLVAELQATEKNSDLLVEFQPLSDQGTGDVIGPDATPTSWVIGFDSMTMLRTSDMQLTAFPKLVSNGGSVMIAGMVEWPQTDTTVEIWSRPESGGTYSLVATVPATLDPDGSATFVYESGALTRSTRFKAVWDGDSRSLGCFGSVRVAVAAKVLLARSKTSIKLGAAVTLAATVRPALTGQRVTFQRWVSSTRRWVTIGQATTHAGSAAYRWRPSARGVYNLRAVVGPSTAAAGGVSASRAVAVK
jgi:hypothetical protein